ncbi:MAG TPA: sugar phosphate isomerase/epimerase family protein [Candidatus Hydrogenedentes bacterium]|nr:sugar phosphate isomerase/epimerase family protein [Candidatus Hydrogenedentota bacterium]HPG66883.1 sugar phosphate isomerase/epimerase family protein [Candidatus Hydrogenedentota bacterium]
MTFSTPTLTLDENLAVARRLGYEGIEPRTVCSHGHGVELEATAARRREIRATAEDAGIVLCCIATSCRYADPATTGAMTEDTLRYIDLAGDVGSPAIRVFGGALPEGVSREQATDLLVRALDAVADRAAQRAVTVCIETHDDWCHPAHLAAVMRQVNHSAIAINWDIMHPVHRGGATMDEAFETLKPWIRHLHVHDGATRDGQWVLVPVGEGDIDHRRALELLDTLGYGGYVSGEWIDWEPYETHLPRELARLKAAEVVQG